MWRRTASGRTAALAALAAILGVVAVSRPAGAYVQARTDAGKPITWQDTTCIGITPDAAFDDPRLDQATILAVLQQSVQAWSSATAACSYLKVQVLAPRSGEVVGFNEEGPNVNLVQFVSSGWRHDRGAAAITTVTFSDLTGRAFDGDIELNSQDFNFAALPESGGLSTETDLANTLTHELGHLMGLDHTCDDGQRTPTPTNHAGQVIPKCCPDTDPTCSRASAAEYLQAYPDVVESTMFNFAAGGETKKRTPHPDDVAGLCAIYPLAASPGVCRPEYDSSPGAGCQVSRDLPATPPRSGSFALGLLALAGLLVRLGRPRRRRALGAPR